MKKVVLAVAVLFSVALVSCGNKENKGNESESVAAETAAVVEETVVEESANGNSVEVVEETAVAAEVK